MIRRFVTWGKAWQLATNTLKSSKIPDNTNKRRVSGNTTNNKKRPIHPVDLYWKYPVLNKAAIKNAKNIKKKQGIEFMIKGNEHVGNR
jgi:hypothetical protein